MPRIKVHYESACVCVREREREKKSEYKKKSFAEMVHLKVNHCCKDVEL